METGTGFVVGDRGVGEAARSTPATVAASPWLIIGLRKTKSSCIATFCSDFGEPTATVLILRPLWSGRCSDEVVSAAAAFTFCAIAIAFDTALLGAEGAVLEGGGT